MSGRAMKKRSREGTATKSYDIGYGRPPVHSRFEKGQSGNPKGRPKGAKSMKALLEEALSSSVTIVENGTPKKTELRHLLFKTLVAKAVKGDARATTVLVRLMEQYGLSKPDGEHGGRGDGSIPTEPVIEDRRDLARRIALALELGK